MYLFVASLLLMVQTTHTHLRIHMEAISNEQTSFRLIILDCRTLRFRPGVIPLMNMEPIQIMVERNNSPLQLGNLITCRQIPVRDLRRLIPTMTFLRDEPNIILNRKLGLNKGPTYHLFHQTQLAHLSTCRILWRHTRMVEELTRCDILPQIRDHHPDTITTLRIISNKHRRG